MLKASSATPMGAIKGVLQLPSVVRPSRGQRILGGNGIVPTTRSLVFFNDCEALYTYEGTFQMQKPHRRAKA